MNADPARQELFASYFVPRETQEKLDLFAEMLLAENQHQNLIARSTEPELWTRHFADSAQLTTFIPVGAKTLLDVGSGAGLPGLVLALMTNLHCTLVEPRRLRANFLAKASKALGLTDRTTVICTKIQKLAAPAFDVITARAFSSLTKTLNTTAGFSHHATCWLLLKGRAVSVELDEASSKWIAAFDTVQSRTASDASIVRVRESQGRRL